MSFWGVVVGSVFQAMLAFFLCMLGDFAGAELINGRSKGIRKATLSILNFSIYLLPLLCIVSGATWRFEGGNHCHTFQKKIMSNFGLDNVKQTK